MRFISRVFAASALLGAAATATTFAAVIYVNAAATGSNNGSSWANAYTSLQTALGAANASDELWVAAGTYKPTATTDRTISFAMKNAVGIYGGFVGTETLRSQRNPALHVTTLSGDIGTGGSSNDNSLPRRHRRRHRDELRRPRRLHDLGRPGRRSQPERARRRDVDQRRLPDARPEHVHRQLRPGARAADCASRAARRSILNSKFISNTVAFNVGHAQQRRRRHLRRRRQHVVAQSCVFRSNSISGTTTGGGGDAELGRGVDAHQQRRRAEQPQRPPGRRGRRQRSSSTALSPTTAATARRSSRATATASRTPSSGEIRPASSASERPARARRP